MSAALSMEEIVRIKQMLSDASQQNQHKYETIDGFKTHMSAGGDPQLACLLIATNGTLEVLLYARSVGCPWNSYTTHNLVLGGKFEMLCWAWDNGCPIDVNKLMSSKAKMNDDIKNWLRADDATRRLKCLEFEKTRLLKKIAEETQLRSARNEVDALRRQLESVMNNAPIVQNQAQNVPASEMQCRQLYGEERNAFVAKCRDLRVYLTRDLGKNVSGTTDGVKRRLIANFPGDGGKWLGELYAAMCFVLHEDWTSDGDPEWLERATQSARNNFIPPV